MDITLRNEVGFGLKLMGLRTDLLHLPEHVRCQKKRYFTSNKLTKLNLKNANKRNANERTAKKRNANETNTKERNAKEINAKEINARERNANERNKTELKTNVKIRGGDQAWVNALTGGGIDSTNYRLEAIKMRNDMFNELSPLQKLLVMN